MPEQLQPKFNDRLSRIERRLEVLEFVLNRLANAKEALHAEVKKKPPEGCKDYEL